MSDLERLTVAFNAMNPWARGMLVELVLGYAEDFPASTTRAVFDAAQGAQSGVDYCNPITNRDRQTMSNISIEASLVDGSAMTYVARGDSCAEAAEIITGDDLRPPARYVAIEVTTESGKTVRVVIPNSATGTAIVQIDGGPL